MTEEGDLLWSPSEATIRSSQLRKFNEYLRGRNLQFADYSALWNWSVTDLESFWGTLWDFFQIDASRRYDRIIGGSAMPGVKWFEGARLNYAEHLLRHGQAASDDRPMLIAYSELRSTQYISGKELTERVRGVATQLRAHGVVAGDRVAGIMPNIPEAVVAMIATMSIGAIWSSAAPEFGTRLVIDRLSQIAPKFLFTVDGYRFAGKDFSRVAINEAILAALPSVQKMVCLQYRGDSAFVRSERVLTWDEFTAGVNVTADDFCFEHVDATAPLWIVFTSGTTGVPKAIVHSHGGMLLEGLKANGLHLDWGSKDRIFIYCSTGWLVWNVLISCLLQGSTAILYDGSPSYPDYGVLWKIAAEAGVTCIGASPSYVQMLDKSGVVPVEQYDLSRLRTIFLTGSPVTPEMYAWVYKNVGRNIWLAVQSGGTEVGTAIVGSVPTLPVYAGEMQARALGVDAHAWNDDGHEIINEIGELVLTGPMPSMPLYFWNDQNSERYKDAYFSKYPGVWVHGDRLRINERGGCYIYGRSDAVLNRNGVRIGSAEIYRTIEQLAEIADSLVVCTESRNGEFYMPLFVQLRDGEVLTDKLKSKIVSNLRVECGPRHVPDDIFSVESIPYTLTGKKMEVPVRKILTGLPVDEAARRDAMRNPDSLDWFANFERQVLNKGRLDS